MTSFLQPRPRGSEEGEQWLSISDLMSGLMVIFLFVAISYLQPLAWSNSQLQDAQQRVRDIVVAFNEDEVRLADELEAALGADLPRWGAELDRPRLIIRFRAPELLFEQGQARLRPEFRRVLDEFLPRYLAILDRNRQAIEEVRIEGHTSSEWSLTSGPTEAFFRNMALSQERTRAVLEVVLTSRALEPFQDWARATITANGLASARPVTRAEGGEDADRSRRVEFRVLTRARERVLRILEEVR
jgi:outer membrane protein OmpA-like peptidoglycan-associated protein